VNPHPAHAPTLHTHPQDDDEGDRVGTLFNRAKQAGAVAGTSADLPGGGSKAFQGQGRSLTGPPQAVRIELRPEFLLDGGGPEP
jgi:hypothetical protein